MTPEEKTAIVTLLGQTAASVDTGAVTSVGDVRRAILKGLANLNTAI